MSFSSTRMAASFAFTARSSAWMVSVCPRRRSSCDSTVACSLETLAPFLGAGECPSCAASAADRASGPGERARSAVRRTGEPLRRPTAIRGADSGRAGGPGDRGLAEEGTKAARPAPPPPARLPEDPAPPRPLRPESGGLARALLPLARLTPLEPRNTGSAQRRKQTAPVSRGDVSWLMGAIQNRSRGDNNNGANEKPLYLS